MENFEENYVPDQTTALLKILELGQAQIANGEVKTMEEVFEKFDKPD